MHGLLRWRRGGPAVLCFQKGREGMRARAVWETSKDAVRLWWDNKGMRLAAAIAFYSMLSLAPLVVVVMTIAGAVFGPDAARGELTAQMKGLAGEEAAQVIENLLKNAWYEMDNGIIATV